MPSHDEVESLVNELEEQANEWCEDWPEGGPPVHLVERAAKMLRELDDRSKGGRGKMERLYIALIHKERGSDFGVSFPEFPGCVTAGSSVEEAFRMAKAHRGQGRAHALTRFRHRFVGQADDHEGGQAAGDRDLRLDLDRVDAEKCHRPYARDHPGAPEGASTNKGV